MNSTDATLFLGNTSEYDQTIDGSPEESETCKTRFSENWDMMLCHPLGMIMCALVIGITLLSKTHITGDYKWFILNQAIANFIFSLSHFVVGLVVVVIYGLAQFFQIYYTDSPVWMTVFYEIVFEQLSKLVAYAPLFTLLATVLNRWMALALPTQYQQLMTPRLIFFYCSLCYLLPLLIDGRLFAMLSFSDALETSVSCAMFLLPWIMSIVISAIIYYRLWKHLRNMTNITDKRRLRDSRNVLHAIIIQTIVPLFDRGFRYVCTICLVLKIFTDEDINNSSIANFFDKTFGVNYLLSSVYTCLVILITMRPYREAVLSLISPVTKLCKTCLMQIDFKSGKSDFTTTSTAVKSIQSKSAHSDTAALRFVSSVRVPSQIVTVVS